MKILSGETSKLLSPPMLIWLAACATTSPPREAPLSIEFGQDLYLTDRYLTDTPDARCGPPAYAPGGLEARSPLPDGSWFSVFAIESERGDIDTVILQRGRQDGDAELVMRLDGREGIVRLRGRDRSDAWGIYHPWADWMRELGARTLALACGPPR